MSIQSNLQKLKKAVSRDKAPYITYDNFKEIHGKVVSIGNLHVYIESESGKEPVKTEIEKIREISLIRKPLF
jgi:hypothetical protein